MPSVQLVPFKPSFRRGLVTHFPIMIWKLSGQICNCPMAPCSGSRVYLSLLDTDVHSDVVMPLSSHRGDNINDMNPTAQFTTLTASAPAQ